MHLEWQSQAYAPDGAIITRRLVVALLLGTLLELKRDGQMACWTALTSHFKLSRKLSAQVDRIGDAGHRQLKGTWQYSSTLGT